MNDRRMVQTEWWIGRWMERLTPQLDAALSPIFNHTCTLASWSQLEPIVRFWMTSRWGCTLSRSAVLSLRHNSNTVCNRRLCNVIVIRLIFECESIQDKKTKGIIINNVLTYLPLPLVWAGLALSLSASAGLEPAPSPTSPAPPPSHNVAHYKTWPLARQRHTSSAVWEPGNTTRRWTSGNLKKKSF